MRSASYVPGGVFVAVFSRRHDLTQDSLEFVDLKDEANDVQDTPSVACLDHVCNLF